MIQDKDGEERRKIALVTKETPVYKMFKYFLELLTNYTYHSFMAKWQKDQFDTLLANLPLNHIICGIMTFQKTIYAVHKMRSNHNISTPTKYQFMSPFSTGMLISKLMERKALKITPPSSKSTYSPQQTTTHKTSILFTMFKASF